MDLDDLRPLLYVAGPYTRDDPVENTHRAIKVATAIYEAGHWVPVVPHLSLLWHLVDPHPYEFWCEYDIYLLRACDAIVRLPGPSSGADAELAAAYQMTVREIPFGDLPTRARCEWVQ